MKFSPTMKKYKNDNTLNTRGLEHTKVLSELIAMWTPSASEHIVSDHILANNSRRARWSGSLHPATHQKFHCNEFHGFLNLEIYDIKIECIPTWVRYDYKNEHSPLLAMTLKKWMHQSDSNCYHVMLWDETLLQVRAF